jgi:hypothetical protein
MLACVSVALIVPTLAASPFRLRPFAPPRPARGAMFSARHRGGQEGELTVPPVIREQVYYGRDV